MRTSARPGGPEVERCAPLDLSPLRPRPPPALPAGAMADDAAHTGAGPIDQQMTQLIQDLRTAHDNEQTTAFLEGYYSRWVEVKGPRPRVRSVPLASGDCLAPPVAGSPHSSTPRISATRGVALTPVPVSTTTVT